MNPYTTRTWARIQPHDVANAVFSDAFIGTTKLPGLERQRGWQAEAEVDRLLKHHGIPPASVSSRIAMVRQTLGAALIRTGQRLGGVSGSAVSQETIPVAGTLETAS